MSLVMCDRPNCYRPGTNEYYDHEWYCSRHYPGRLPTWYWRVWWKIGYWGPYQINWWWKRRTGQLK